jgi:hypothetical protein
VNRRLLSEANWLLGSARLAGVPKIDWIDDGDDQPRSEPRPRRERLKGEALDRRTRFQLAIAVAASPPYVADLPVKLPLHLIWGAPIGPHPAQPET